MKEDIRLNPPWKELVKVAQLWEYGTVHTHDEISDIMGIEKQSTSYYQSVSRADQELVLIGKHMEVITKTGYRVINPDEYIRSSNDKVRQAMKHDRIGLVRILNAPRDKMDDPTKKRTEEHAVSMSRRHSLLSSSAKPLFEIEQQQAKRMLNTGKPKVLASGE